MSVPALPIDGDRVRLRVADSGDIDALVRLATDPDVRRYLGGPRDAESAREGVERNFADGACSPLNPVVVDAGTRQFLGTLDLSRRDTVRPGHTQPQGNELELSYVFLPEAWGKGFARESIRLFLRAWASCLPDQDVLVVTQSANAASIALAQRLGFEFVETFDEFGAEQWLGVARLASFAE